MKVVIQRVTQADVKVASVEGGKRDKVIGEIERGLMVLVGITDSDTDKDIQWMTTKICNLRIFDDSNGVMNLSVKDIDGGVLLISQFTLQGNAKKGNRPSYINAAKREIAIPIYNKLIESITKELGKRVETGEFGADMKVSLINDGPVTIIIDSKE